MARRSRKTFSNYEVALYWNQVQSGYLVGGEDIDVLSLLDVSMNYPQCFACGHSKYTYLEWECKIEDRKKLWNNSRLEKHHFHPLSLDGEDEISNIVILCKRCHSEAPTVALNLEEIIKWCLYRKSEIDWALKILKESLNYALDRKFSTAMEKENFLKWLSNKKIPTTDEIRRITKEKKITTHYRHIPADTYPYFYIKEYENEMSLR
ncbi:HNH endonuclease [Priestia sp. SB1]|uniref:HNH endonuclease n=1 Tax=Priestia sp. SB1 TaxID=3132359 RepID=UPI0031823520